MLQLGGLSHGLSNNYNGLLNTPFRNNQQQAQMLLQSRNSKQDYPDTVLWNSFLVGATGFNPSLTPVLSLGSNSIIGNESLGNEQMKQVVAQQKLQRQLYDEALENYSKSSGSMKLQFNSPLPSTANEAAVPVLEEDPEEEDDNEEVVESPEQFHVVGEANIQIVDNVDSIERAGFVIEEKEKKGAYNEYGFPHVFVDGDYIYRYKDVKNSNHDVAYYRCPNYRQGKSKGLGPCTVSLRLVKVKGKPNSFTCYTVNHKGCHTCHRQNKIDLDLLNIKNEMSEMVKEMAASSNVDDFKKTANGIAKYVDNYMRKIKYPGKTSS